jgi:hypothetical protein
MAGVKTAALAVSAPAARSVRYATICQRSALLKHMGSQLIIIHGWYEKVICSFVMVQI